MKVELNKNEMEVLKELLGGINFYDAMAILSKRNKYKNYSIEELSEVTDEIQGVYGKVNRGLKELNNDKPFNLVTEKIVQVNGFNVVELSYNEISLDKCETKCTKKEYVFNKMTFDSVDSVLHYMGNNLEWNKVYVTGGYNSVIWRTQIFENNTSINKVNMYQLFLPKSKRGETKYYVSKDIKEIEKIISEKNKRKVTEFNSEYMF